MSLASPRGSILPPRGLGPWRRPCNAWVHRCGRSRARLPVGAPGTTAPSNGLTTCGMRAAYCRRGFGTTASSPLRQHARALALLSMARSDCPTSGSIGPGTNANRLAADAIPDACVSPAPMHRPLRLLVEGPVEAADDLDRSNKPTSPRWSKRQTGSVLQADVGRSRRVPGTVSVTHGHGGCPLPTRLRIPAREGPVSAMDRRRTIEVSYQLSITYPLSRSRTALAMRLATFLTSVETRG